MHGKDNCEKRVLLWYQKCRPGYHKLGCCLCTPNCVEGMKDYGLSCRKKFYGRTAGKRMGCRADQDKSLLACYPKCSSDYNGVGPVCWAKCPPGYNSCGAFCSKNCKKDIIMPIVGGALVAGGGALIFAAPLASLAGAGFVAASLAVAGAGCGLAALGATGTLVGMGAMSLGSLMVVGGPVVSVVGAVGGAGLGIGLGVAGAATCPCYGAGTPLLVCAGVAGGVGVVMAVGGVAMVPLGFGMIAAGAVMAGVGTISMLAGGTIATLGAAGVAVGITSGVVGTVGSVAIGLAGIGVGTAILVKSLVKPMCPRISEIKPPPPPKPIPEWDRVGVIILFSEPNFKGRQHALVQPGVYNWCMGTLLIGNGKVRSVKLPPGFKVTLYQHSAWGTLCGQTEELFSDTAELKKLDSQVSGVRVEMIDPRQDRRYPDECSLGTSNSLTKSVDIPPGTLVPQICGPDCCRSGGEGPESFRLAVTGNRLSATRTDCPDCKGWKTDMKVACRKPLPPTHKKK